MFLFLSLRWKPAGAGVEPAGSVLFRCYQLCSWLQSNPVDALGFHVQSRLHKHTEKGNKRLTPSPASQTWDNEDRQADSSITAESHCLITVTQVPLASLVKVHLSFFTFGFRSVSRCQHAVQILFSCLVFKALPVIGSCVSFTLNIITDLPLSCWRLPSSLVFSVSCLFCSFFSPSFPLDYSYNFYFLPSSIRCLFYSWFTSYCHCFF